MVRAMMVVVAVVALVLSSISMLLPDVRAVAVKPGAFERTWARTDKPIVDGQVQRTWMWGPEAFSEVRQEPYQDAPGGMHTVQYFDKSRMEDNTWRTTTIPWDVTNGLLVVEMVDGRYQVGDVAFDESPEPAPINIAGDPAGEDGLSPTYADLDRYGLRATPATAVGTVLTTRIDAHGVVTADPSKASHGVTAAHRVQVPLIDHTVASVFWDFVNSQGGVYEDGQIVVDRLFENPFYATGYPITEAYWSSVMINGSVRDVLWQCFERRCLTYTPGNSAGFLVEAGNVGQHYERWRYDLPITTPTPTGTLTSPVTPPVTPSTPTSTPPTSNCHPSYPDFCVPPPPPDLDCGDIAASQKPMTVLHNVEDPDPHLLDNDGDGIGCETTATQPPTVTMTPTTPPPAGCSAAVQATITNVTDGLGHSNPNSWAKGTGGDWTGGLDAAPRIAVGTRLTITVEAAGECPIEYRFQKQPPGGSFILLRDWSTNATFTYTIKAEDYGQWFYIIPEIRDSDPRQRFGTVDDYNYLSYIVE